MNQYLTTHDSMGLTHGYNIDTLAGFGKFFYIINQYLRHMIRIATLKHTFKNPEWGVTIIAMGDSPWFDAQNTTPRGYAVSIGNKLFAEQCQGLLVLRFEPNNPIDAISFLLILDGVLIFPPMICACCAASNFVT